MHRKLVAPIAFSAFAPKSLAEGCDPKLAGSCIPVASYVDCAGGNRNGPEYVSGPVHVINRDICILDRDGDGVACEN